MLKKRLSVKNANAPAGSRQIQLTADSCGCYSGGHYREKNGQWPLEDMPIMLNDKFIFYDGAMGTMLQAGGHLPHGQRSDFCNFTAPESVKNIHEMYINAGSDIICTNTFGANAIALDNTGYSPADVITAGVRIAKEAAKSKAKVALDIGPIGIMSEPLGELTFDQAYALFKEQAVIGVKAGADICAIETMSDLTEITAAIRAVTENTGLPVFATMTFDKTGRTFTGCTPEDFAKTAQKSGASAIGLNCSLQPSEMIETAKRIANTSDLPLIIKPNAGLPDSNTGLYNINPAEFAEQMAVFANIGNTKIFGGCCGTTPEYIRELKNAFAGHS